LFSGGIAAQGVRAMTISFISWIVLGLIAGVLANLALNQRGKRLPVYVGLGIVGAVFGGWLFKAMGTPGVASSNVWSFFVAAVGAVVSLSAWHVMRGPVPRA
jgi:uncharacterized membrane protein YeaQ/YmgE (transglycosylase-associated protein family)